MRLYFYLVKTAQLKRFTPHFYPLARMYVPEYYLLLVAEI